MKGGRKEERWSIPSCWRCFATKYCCILLRRYNFRSQHFPSCFTSFLLSLFFFSFFTSFLFPFYRFFRPSFLFFSLLPLNFILFLFLCIFLFFCFVFFFFFYTDLNKTSYYGFTYFTSSLSFPRNLLHFLILICFHPILVEIINHRREISSASIFQGIGVIGAFLG